MLVQRQEPPETCDICGRTDFGPKRFCAICRRYVHHNGVCSIEVGFEAGANQQVLCQICQDTTEGGAVNAERRADTRQRGDELLAKRQPRPDWARD